MCSSTIIMTAFAPFAQEISAGYGVGAFSTSYTLIIFQIVYIPLNFVANYLFDKNGILFPTIIASVLYIAGSWVRLLVWENENGFYWIMIGQTVAACGQPFMLQAPPKIAATWFGDGERVLGTTIGALAGPVGCVIGFVMPVLFLTVEPDSSAKTVEEMKSYLIWQNGLVTLFALPIIFLI